MERKEKTLFLFLLLLLFQVYLTRSTNCTIYPNKNPSCYNDFNNNITCFWNTTVMSDHMDTVCTISAEYQPRNRFGSSCTLKVADASKPAMQKCSIKMKRTYDFQSTTVLSMNLSCNHLKESQIWFYKPGCHIKLNPPPKPNVNSTIVSWSYQVPIHDRVRGHKSQLQWKQVDQSWSDPSVQKNIIQKESKSDCDDELEFKSIEFKAELDSELLVKGETYEARVRILENDNELEGTWSDWSPTESWLSSVGKPKPQSESVLNILHMTAVSLALFGLMLIFIILKTNKTTWVYIVKRVTGPPLPHPTLLEPWFSSNFTSETLHSLLKPVEIVTVEVTANVDAVTPFRPDVKMRTEKNNLESTSSSFSNPSYSDVGTPPVSSLASGALEPCTSDSPYGPVCGQEEGKHTEDYGDVVAEKKKEILSILKGSINSESVLVIPDYERVEKLQLERLRLQSTDSGMCSCEEVSQESMEADSINVSDDHDEGHRDKKEEGQDASKLDFLKLFGDGGSILGQPSIQVCSDYERFPKLHLDHPELPSSESGVGTEGEEHESREENREENDKPTETSLFHLPPESSNAVPCSQLFSGSGLNPHLQPLLGSGIFEKLALMSDSRLTDCSYDDGYLPVRQGQS